MKDFLNDLYSGKLHREFHYGPDPESTSEAAQVGLVCPSIQYTYKSQVVKNLRITISHFQLRFFLFLTCYYIITAMPEESLISCIAIPTER